MAALQRRVEDLIPAVVAHMQTEQQLREAEHRLLQVLESTNEMIAFTVRGHFVDMNQRLLDGFGYPKEELVGMSVLDVTSPADRDQVMAHFDSGSLDSYAIMCVRKDGSPLAVEIRSKPITYRGQPGRVAAMRDVTELRRAEAANRTALVQREVIRAQEALLSELSSPLLPIGDDIVVLPLIGAVTAERANQVVTALAVGVAKNRARTAILDITGVPDVDAHVADALIHAARAVQLLGARVVLTGIRPEVAQRIIHLGIDLTGIVTHGTLQRGVAHALAQRGRGRRASP